MKFIIILFSALMTVTVCLAAEPDEILSDPGLEARAKALDAQLRCVVCQSQSISESDAPLAKDLRILVRERITHGDSDAQTLDYIVERYGDYVLMKPPFQSNTVFLWVFPGLALLLAAGGAFVFLRSAKTAPVVAAPLSEDEEAAVNRIIDERR